MIRWCEGVMRLFAVETRGEYSLAHGQVGGWVEAVIRCDR